jgi:hypothetical protein
MGIDEVSLLLGRLDQRQSDQGQALEEVKQGLEGQKTSLLELRELIVDGLRDLGDKITELNRAGCSRGIDHEKRISHLESRPKRLAAAVAAAVGSFVVAVIEAIKALRG